MKKAIIKISICLTAVLFAVSCGNNANTSTNPTPTPTPKNLSVTYTFLNYGDDRIDVNTDANYNQVKKEAGLKITVSPTVSVDAKITKVTSAGIALEPTDFQLSKTSSITTGSEMKITLSSTGIEKLKSAAKKTQINYTLSIEFTTTSDEVENKTYTRDIAISVMPLQEITKTQVETMMITVGSLSLNGSSASRVSYAKFDLSDFVLDTTFNDFSDVASSETYEGATYSAKNAAATLYPKMSLAEGLNTPDYSSTTASGKTATLVFKFTPKLGYCFANDIETVMTSGLKVKLVLTKGTWN